MTAQRIARNPACITRLIPLVVSLLLLGMGVACNRGAFSDLASGTGQRSDTTSDLRRGRIKENREPDFVLLDRNITEAELEDVASYPVLWPDPVPTGCSLQGISEMSESPTESTGSGIFILKYRCHLRDWFHIHESPSMSPNLAGREPIDYVDVNGATIPLYDDGGIWEIFLTINGVKVELDAKGLSKEEITAIASNLRPRRE